MKRVCKASHVPAPTARIGKARKATEAKTKKTKREGEKKTLELDRMEPVRVQDTAHQPASREDIERSIERQEEQVRFREEDAKEDGIRPRFCSGTLTLG
jgi:hypothetical protein